MKYLTTIIALSIILFTSCTKVDSSLPDNVFSGQNIDLVFEDVSLVYLDGQNKARISYEVNFDILSVEQRERITGFYVNYNGTPRIFDGIDRRSFAFPVPIGEEVCVQLGVAAEGVRSTSITPVCKTF